MLSGIIFVLGLFSLLFIVLLVYFKAIEPELKLARLIGMYRLKIIEDDLKKENISFEDLENPSYKFFFNAKKNRKSYLDEVKRQVRGELKDIKNKKR